MGRIVAQVKLQNMLHPENAIECNALVDTGAAYMTLPNAWREQLGELICVEEVELATATGHTVHGELASPTRLTIEGFRSVTSEILFVDMEPDDDGRYEPLLGYIPLEQTGLAVDMLGHRLIKLKRFDLK